MSQAFDQPFEPAPRPRLTGVKPFPAVQLVLHLEPQADLMHAVRTIMELLRFCVAEATHRMWKAHHNGVAILFTLHRERAELYVEQFAERGLHVTIEKSQIV